MLSVGYINPDPPELTVDAEIFSGGCYSQQTPSAVTKAQVVTPLAVKPGPRIQPRIATTLIAYFGSTTQNRREHEGLSHRGTHGIFLTFLTFRTSHDHP